MFLHPSEPYRLNVGARDGPLRLPIRRQVSALLMFLEGAPAGRRRLQPRTRLEVLELFPDGQIAGVFEPPQMGGQVAAGKAERLLDEPIGQPSRLRLGDQQSHYS